MLLPFWKVTPSGNPTILLRAQDVGTEQRTIVANAVMSDQHICGEQVGYIRLEGTPRLDMMGGEFCLNATRAFAHVLDELGLLERDGNGTASGQVEVSGADDVVNVRVTRNKGALPFVEACLNFEELPEPELLTDGLRLIRVPGITHLVQDGAVPSFERLEQFCAEQRNTCRVTQEEAVGHLWLSCGENIDSADRNASVSLALDPVVWVRDTATLCRESACGSGTLACALAEYARSGATEFSILQPSGTDLSVRIVKKDEGGWSVWVGGPSRLTTQGMTDLTGLM